jgi:acyl-homoserine-lactone acylase
MRILLLLLALAPAWAGYKVTIHRDEYGVPHIYGRTDPDVVFGLALCMAEDNFWQFEEDYIRHLGRAALVYGRAELEGDLRFRLFEVEKRSRAAYLAAPAALRAVADAFAAGYNDFLRRNPTVKPRLLRQLQGWEVMAFQEGAPSLAGAGVTREDVRREFPLLAGLEPAENPGEGDEGSNMWAISPRKSASGKAMLFLNPHVGFFGGGQRYEAHLESGQGLHVSGFAILGTPYIRSGFTARHGWCHTNNNADLIDVWREPESPSDLVVWTERIPVKGGEPVQVRMRKTRHGAVVGMRDGRMLAKRGPEIASTGLMTQRIAMAKARSLAEFQAAMRMRAMTGSNTMYADAKGNIWYLHGNAIPRRSPALDWSQPVDGPSADAEWQGLHAFEDLPQFLNPSSGFLQNCNSTPLYAAGEPGDSKTYPKYLVPEPDNFRAKRSREILTGRDRFSFDDWARAALDTGVYLARREKEALAKAWPAFRTQYPERAARLAPAVTEIERWDGVSRNDSVPMALFMTAFGSRKDRSEAAPFLTPESLEQAIAELEKDHGKWQVGWGEINRMQRVHTSGREERYSDARPSWPVPGAPGTVGIVFNFYTTRPPGQKKLYGRMGNSYIAVVEFGKKIRAGSLLVFGQSADPASPHFADQAPLYSGQRFKTVHYYRDDVKRSSRGRITVDRR